MGIAFTAHSPLRMQNLGQLIERLPWKGGRYPPYTRGVKSACVFSQPFHHGKLEGIVVVVVGAADPECARGGAQGAGSRLNLAHGAPTVRAWPRKSSRRVRVQLELLWMLLLEHHDPFPSLQSLCSITDPKTRCWQPEEAPHSRVKRQNLTMRTCRLTRLMNASSKSRENR